MIDERELASLHHSILEAAAAQVLAFYVPWLPHTAVLFLEGVLLSMQLHAKMHLQYRMVESVHNSVEMLSCC